MGEVNDKMCRLMSTKVYFADFWNGAVWKKSKKIQATQLSRDDKEYYKFLKKSSSIRRDVLMKARGETAGKLGIEIMETIDYTIPARIMDYDAQEIKRQLNDIAIQNRKLVEIEQISWEKYDGAYGIADMSQLDRIPDEYREQFHDYPLRFYSLRELDEMCFETGLRELVAVFKRSKDRTAMKKYYEENQERFRQLDILVIDAIGH